MNPAWAIRTGRLHMTPVSWADLADLHALKSDPGVFGQMLGGVRSALGVADDLQEELSYWARNGVGLWIVRTPGDNRAVGLTGLHDRPDGRNPALRFAFRPEVRGKGLAREAASAALFFAHDRAGLARVLAMAREANFASRTVLGAIGMRPVDSFERGGETVLVYESRRVSR